MSTLTSSSTDAEVRAAYDDNAGYAEDASTSKAAAFITACRILIRRMSDEQSHGPARLRLTENLRQLRNEMNEAQSWLAANGGTSQITAKHASFVNFRS